MIVGMDLDLAWYDAIAVRRSRRRYGERRIAKASLAALQAFCDEHSLEPGACVWLAQDSGDLFKGMAERFGGYGRVEGAPWTAAFVAPKGAELEAGYVGEAFVLEATRLGLDTCWVAGMFDRKTAAGLVPLKRGERVIAVTPVGHALDRKQFVERMMSAAVRSAARHQVEHIAPGLVHEDGPAGVAWPAWAIAAVEAARLAPSGANKQPWRFRLHAGAIVLSAAEKTYWTAPIDYGIAMLHVELGALHEGVRGAWDRLPAPDVARFTPART